MMLLLDEADYRELEATAKAAGIAISDVVRMRIRGFEPARRVA